MIDPELLEALKSAAAERPEMSESAVIRQALREWFKRNGVTVKAAPRRVRPRRKA